MADKNERSVYIGAVSGCNVISAEKAVVPPTIQPSTPLLVTG